jgi:hypothetical protein
MIDQSDIDQRLRESGKVWRDELPQSRGIDEWRFRTSHVGRRSWHVLSAATRLIAAAAVVFVLIRALPPPSTGSGTALGSTSAPVRTSTTSAESQHPTTTDTPAVMTTPSNMSSVPSGAPSPDPTPSIYDNVVSVGDQVVAFGHLFEAGTGAWLCPQVVGFPPDVGCIGTVFVRVNGLDPRDYPGQEAQAVVPGSDQPERRWVTEFLRVEGSWDGSAVEAIRVIPADQQPLGSLFEPPGVPCDAPIGGWTGESGSGDQEAAAAALQAEVTQNPETYVGVWSAEPDPSTDPTLSVVVVGTVEDVESVGPRLRSIYAYDLCIVRADYSRAELDEALRELAVEGRNWELYVDPAIARVVVKVPAFDHVVSEAIGRFSDLVAVRAIVVRAGS